MKLTAQRILALWQDDPAWRGGPRDIQQRLHLKASHARPVQAALDQLVEEGELTVRRGVYGLPYTAPPAGPRGPSHTGPAAPAIMEGMFSAHPDGYGFVAVGALKQSLFIPPPDVAGALDGDWVRVEMIPARGRHRTAARVAEVLQRRRARVRGHLEREGRELWLLPLNERLPDVRVTLPAGVAAADGALVDAVLTRFPDTVDEYPEAKVLGAVSESEDPEQIIDNILANTSLHLGFSKETLAEMGKLGHDLPAPAGPRLDLTHLPFCTIDPVDARDMDDAVCMEALPGGAARLWVAIADVAAYVRMGMAVDADAYAKGTSVYFPSRVLPMLPEELSGDRCSLRAGEARAAMVCQMEIDPAGETTRASIVEATIRSRAKLNYGQVLRFFETGEAGGIPEALLPGLSQLRELARRLREKRERRGALAFEFPEGRFELDAQGMPTRIVKSLPTEATRLIEQCMLEANEAVARVCAEQQLPVLYRVHDPPPGDAVENLVLQLWNAGIQTKPKALETSGGINAVLRQLEQHPLREQIELTILKSMSQAVYRDSNDGHYALAATHYCHFTSPIRRYPDLIVHRALKAWLKGGPQPRGKERGKSAAQGSKLPTEAGAHLSAYERIAADAEQQVARLYRVLYMEPRVGEDFAARVTGLSERGITVSLRDEFVDGFLPPELLRDDFYRLDPRRNVLEGRRHRRKVGLGALLTVTLVRADRLTQQMEFGFVRWEVTPIPTPRPPPLPPQAEEGQGELAARGGAPKRRKSDKARPLPGAPA